MTAIMESDHRKAGSIINKIQTISTKSMEKPVLHTFQGGYV